MVDDKMGNYIWVKVEPGSFKVWGCTPYTNEKTGESNIIIYFGSLGKRIGELRHLNKWFNTARGAVDYYFDKSREKQHNGYLPLDQVRYDKYVDDNDIFGLLAEVKKVYKKWNKIE